MKEQSIIKRRSAAAQSASIDRIVKIAKAPLIDKLEKCLQEKEELIKVMELIVEELGDFQNIQQYHSFALVKQAIRKAKGE